MLPWVGLGAAIFSNLEINMKTTLLFLSALIMGASTYACARTTTMPMPVESATQTQVAPVALVVDDTDKDRAQKEYDAKVKEEKDYNVSVERIEANMSKEYLQYQMCLSTHKKDKNVCKQILTEFCSIDVVVDSRGGNHKKRYCKLLDKR